MKSEAGERIPEIDGLRGVAVLGVLIWHFTGSMAPNDGSIVSSILLRSTVFGRTGVDLFFVLSGFLIIGILIDYRKSPNLFRVFYTRRFFRIWPPYLTLIALYWVCYVHFGESEGFNTRYGSWKQFLAQITFNWNILMSIHDSGIARGFSVAWSVNIEEWFYIVFAPLVVFVRPARLPAVLIAVGLSSALARTGYHLAYPSAWLPPYVLLPFRLDGLCVGGLIAFAVRNPELLPEKRVISKTALIMTVIAVIAVVASLRGLDRQMYIWGHLYLSLTFGAVVLWASQCGSVALRNKSLREIGRYSYTLYLVHPLFISLFFQLYGRSERVMSPHDALLAAAALASSVAFSVASYWLLERRLIAVGHHCRYERPIT